MYLPTFWKLSSEVYMYKMCKVAGWGLPAACMGKSTDHCACPVHPIHKFDAQSELSADPMLLEMVKSCSGPIIISQPLKHALVSVIMAEIGLRFRPVYLI